MATEPTPYPDSHSAQGAVRRITRNRDQRGTIKEETDRWKIRWHEPKRIPRAEAGPLRKDDKVLPDGSIERKIYRQSFLSKKNYPTKTKAEHRLAEIVAPFQPDRPKVNGISSAGLHAIEVELCDDCRKRLLAALQYSS